MSRQTNMLMLLAALAAGTAAGLAAPGPAAARRYSSSVVVPIRPEKPSWTEAGGASYYGERHHGQRTASGETFDSAEFTAAHRSLRFGTVVRVTNLRNGRMVKVRITDRGPHAGARVIDISAAAAREIGMFRRGLARVRLRVFASDQLNRQTASAESL